MSDLKIFSNKISVKDKRVIVRLDLNVPIKNSEIDDNTRIKVVEPFINKLIKEIIIFDKRLHKYNSIFLELYFLDPHPSLI